MFLRLRSALVRFRMIVFSYIEADGTHCYSGGAHHHQQRCRRRLHIVIPRRRPNSTAASHTLSCAPQQQLSYMRVNCECSPKNQVLLKGIRGGRISIITAFPSVLAIILCYIQPSAVIFTPAVRMDNCVFHSINVRREWKIEYHIQSHEEQSFRAMQNLFAFLLSTFLIHRISLVLLLLFELHTG